MPIFLVDPANLDKAYSWMGAVYAPAHGGTHPVPADLTAQIAVLMAYIEARNPKKPDDGGGTTDLRTTPPSRKARQTAPKTPTAQTNGGAGTTPVVTLPQGNGNGKVIDTGDPPGLPEGFPGKAEFEAEGHTTLAAVEALADLGELQTVSGVGPKIEEQVTQYLDAFKD